VTRPAENSRCVPYGREARSAITGITLLAGFANTVGWPFSGVLIDAFGWRGAALGWAGLHLLVALPLNWFLVPRQASEALQSPMRPAVRVEAEAPGRPWTRWSCWRQFLA
jgi:predicted MFS family arabinose efflux permease